MVAEGAATTGFEHELIGSSGAPTKCSARSSHTNRGMLTVRCRCVFGSPHDRWPLISVADSRTWRRPRNSPQQAAGRP